MTNLQLKKFDPSKIGDDKVCVFIGKRGTGKSTLVTDIMYHKRHLPVGIVMSGTEDAAAVLADVHQLGDGPADHIHPRNGGREEETCGDGGGKGACCCGNDAGHFTLC